MNWHILLLYTIVIIVQLTYLSSGEFNGANADQQMQQPAIRDRRSTSPQHPSPQPPLPAADPREELRTELKKSLDTEVDEALHLTPHQIIYHLLNLAHPGKGPMDTESWHYLHALKMLAHGERNSANYNALLAKMDPTTREWQNGMEELTFSDPTNKMVDLKGILYEEAKQLLNDEGRTALNSKIVELLLEEKMPNKKKDDTKSTQFLDAIKMLLSDAVNMAALSKDEERKNRLKKILEVEYENSKKSETERKSRWPLLEGWDLLSPTNAIVMDHLLNEEGTKFLTQNKRKQLHEEVRSLLAKQGTDSPQSETNYLKIFVKLLDRFLHHAKPHRPLNELAVREFKKIYAFLRVLNLPKEYKQKILDHLKYLSDKFTSEPIRQILNIKYSMKMEILGIDKPWDQLLGAIKDDKAKFWENFAVFRDELGKFNLEMRTSGLMNLDGLERIFTPLFHWANDWFAELEKKKPKPVIREPEKPKDMKGLLALELEKKNQEVGVIMEIAEKKNEGANGDSGPGPSYKPSLDITFQLEALIAKSKTIKSDEELRAKMAKELVALRTTIDEMEQALGEEGHDKKVLNKAAALYNWANEWVGKVGGQMTETHSAKIGVATVPVRPVGPPPPPPPRPPPPPPQFVPQPPTQAELLPPQNVATQVSLPSNEETQPLAALRMPAAQPETANSNKLRMLTAFFQQQRNNNEPMNSNKQMVLKTVQTAIEQLVAQNRQQEKQLQKEEATLNALSILLQNDEPTLTSLAQLQNLTAMSAAAAAK